MTLVVLDTSVLVAGLRSRSGASNGLLRLVAVRKLRPLLTTALFLEYEEVLKRPTQRLAHGLALADIDGFLAAYAAAAAPVEVRFRWRPQLADPGDELVLEAAVNGLADVLLTHNIKDFKPAARFGLRVETPGHFFKGLTDE